MDKKEKIKEVLNMLEDDLAKKEVTILHHCLYLELVKSLVQNEGVYLGKIAKKMDIQDSQGHIIETFLDIKTCELFKSKNFYTQFISVVFNDTEIIENFEPILKSAAPTNDDDITVIVPYREAISNKLNIGTTDSFRTHSHYDELLYSAMSTTKCITEKLWLGDYENLPPNQIYLAFNINSEGKVSTYMESIILNNQEVLVPQIMNAVWAPRNMSHKILEQSVRIIYPDLGLAKGEIDKFLVDANLDYIVPGDSFGYNRSRTLDWRAVEKMFKWYHID